MSGAVRMVAWGVMEYQSAPRTVLTSEQEEKDKEILWLVDDEFSDRGWMLRPWRNQFGVSMGFILLGALNTTPALNTREKIGEGTLKEVCLAAVAYDDIWSVIP